MSKTEERIKKLEQRVEKLEREIRWIRTHTTLPAIGLPLDGRVHIPIVEG